MQQQQQQQQPDGQVAEVNAKTAPAKPPRLRENIMRTQRDDVCDFNKPRPAMQHKSKQQQQLQQHAKKQLQFRSPLLGDVEARARSRNGSRQLNVRQNLVNVTTRIPATSTAATETAIATTTTTTVTTTLMGKQAQNDQIFGMPSSRETTMTMTPVTATETPTTTTTTMGAVMATKTQATAIKNRLAQGCTSLMYACQHGDVAAVLTQLRSKPELIRQRDSRNKNALHYCAAQNVQETRDLVAAASIAIAAPELLESADEDGFTPLHLAVIQGNLAMVNLLLANKADVNAVDNEAHSVVHWATVCGEVEALRAVLAAGANVAKPDINGGSPLHYAAQMCGASYEGKLGQSNSSKLALEILGILLVHPHCSVDVQDKDGRQPLLWAASAGSAKAVIALVKAGARVESADKDGLTALHCAASRGHTECIDTLISLCGAPTDLIDANGCTALHYAVTLGHADATARLLDLEADPNRQDRKGRTPAHCGCSKGQFETLKLLKERGANLWLRNAKGDLPVHEAAASGRRELVEWLLEQRPKQVNTTSNDGRSMLHIAAANDYTDMCKMLIDYGGDINALYRNSKGVVLTPLDCALQRGHRSTAKFLQSHGGLPSNKLRMAARRANPFHEATSDMVRPLKYVEKEEIHDLRNSKKYVVYLKRSDSDNGVGEENGERGIDAGDGDCSCTEQTYRREQRYEHTCRRHKRRQMRRRTSSCGEAKHTCRDRECSDICRSKSNIELRRRKSRERYTSSSEGDHGDDDDGDSCENCCYHKRQKQRVVPRKRTTSMRRSKGSKGSDDEIHDAEQAKSIEEPKAGSKEREVEVVHEVAATSVSSQSVTAPKSPTASATKEGTFIKSPPQSAKSAEKQAEAAQPITESHAMELTDEELDAHKPAEVVTTQVDVHRDAEQADTLKSSDELPSIEQTAEVDVKKQELKQQLSEEDAKEVAKEVETVIKIAATALSSASKSSSEETSVQQPQVEAATESKTAVEERKQLEDVSAKVETVKSEEPPTKPTTPKADMSNEAKDTAKSVKKPTAKKPASPAAINVPAATERPKTPKSSLSGEQKGEAPKPKSATKQQSQPTKPQHKTPPATSTQQQQAQPQPQPQPQPQVEPQREQESRRSFTLLPSDSADDEPADSTAAATAAESERKSSFQILKSDESVGDLQEAPRQHEVEFSDSQVFKVVHDDSKLHSEAELSSPERGILDKEQGNFDYEEYGEEDDEEDVDGGEGSGADDIHDSPLRRFLSSRQGVGSTDGAAIANVYEASGRKRRLKKRVRSGAKTRSNWKHAQDAREGTAATGKDHDSGFEPSPRATKSKIPTPRNVYTAYMPRRHIYATLDGRSCSSRLENRKPGDKGACDMAAVTRSIQRNIRRYYMERKIFQHLLELKSLQIRSNKLNEAVLVKRAVDDYHKSCVSLGGETGTRLRRYNFSEYTFKNFELFLYETLKGLQKPGTYNFQNINEVYEEAERRLSPDYNAYEKALQCTTKTHRCLHAAHAYTGIPCAAYIPMMNHHTMPKFGFGPYKKTSVSSFYLPKILTGGCGGGRGHNAIGGSCSGKVALELSHGKSRQLISLPSEKLDSNKRYYVTFTVKETATTGVRAAATAGGGAGGGAATADTASKAQQPPKDQRQSTQSQPEH